ncbi:MULTISPECIES: aminotransferase-like domain-containing protein [unclassified Bradyrhizobium]
MSETYRYEDIVRTMSGLIERGVLRPGDRMPSLRYTCKKSGSSLGTIMHAYARLEDLGIIEARPRSGYYVRSRPSRRAPEPVTSSPPAESTEVDVAHLVFDVLETIKRPEIVPLGSAFPSPEHFPTEKLNKAAADAARRLPVWSSVRDLPPGNVELRRLIALRYAEAGVDIAPDDIVITCGAMEAINLSLNAVAKPGDIVAIESPTFYSTLLSIERMGMKVVEIATSPRDGIDLPSLRNALSSLEVAACVVMPNFQNPLGALIPDEKKRELVAMLARTNTPLIEDDVYAELYYGKSKPRPAKSFDRSGLVLHCGSFAKCLAPGSRIGWVTPGRFMSEVERLKFISTISTSSLPQAALVEYLKHGGYERHLRGFRQRLMEALAAMTEAVTTHFPAGCRLTQPQGGYMLWVEMPNSIDALRLYQLALANGISIVPGPLFSAKRKYENFVRLNYGHYHVKSTVEAVRTLGRLSADLMR